MSLFLFSIWILVVLFCACGSERPATLTGPEPTSTGTIKFNVTFPNRPTASSKPTAIKVINEVTAFISNATGDQIIETDLEKCFDKIDHDTLLSIIGRKIKDERLLKLLRSWLRAGYMENWQYHQTYSGTPQGSGLSPLMANILLNELDESSWVARSAGSGKFAASSCMW